MAGHIEYLLHLADNALILGQRNAEWCGHGPVLEEDIAMANISLDLIGQARLLYQHVAVVQNSHKAGNSAPDITEDTLAYFRDAAEFRNYTLLELPHFPSATGLLAATAASERDFATTIVRNFLYSALMVLLWEALQDSSDSELAAIAAKSLKEVRYHLRHSRDWLVRFGDGTDESRARAQSALQHLMPYTQEFWAGSATETAAAATGVGVLPATTLRDSWDAIVDDALDEATLQRPAPGGYVTQGKHGRHSEHLGHVLGEMQSLARLHPGATW